ncbi:hypothetical protein [Nocardiopsis ganjiahuensis]|uniref:hypothetical protein n=1 Tax=Nocardiopsis ganjiahuensis TaxID=239984 RepID=UPI000365C891|nr:hypothetical protein [Nocardiopsis ganjiahuensis]
MDNRFRCAEPGDNGRIDAQSPTPRTSRRLSDRLIRSQIRAQNDPRRTGRVAGAGFGLLLFLAMGLGFLLAAGDRPSYLLLVLAVVGAVLGAAVFAVAVSALAHRSVSGNPLPAHADPSEVRAARRVLRTGELSGRPAVDRIARILAAQALRHAPHPALFGVLGGLWGLYFCAHGLPGLVYGGGGLVNGLQSVLGVLLLVGAVAVPLTVAAQNRRARAFAGAYDARSRAGGRLRRPETRREEG